MIRNATIRKLIMVHRTIAEYIRGHYEAPSMSIIVKMGLCKSPNTVRVWFNQMVELKMALRTPSGSIYLQPLKEADKRVREILREEKTHGN